MGFPKFSIITPVNVHSQERLSQLYRAIDSVKNQTYRVAGEQEGLWEHIIVDDGSPVAWEVPDYPWIKKFEQPHLERMIALNLAFENSTKDWFVFLDSISGDRLIPIKIGNEIDVIPIEELFENHKNRIIYKRGKEFIEFKKDDNIQTLSANEPILIKKNNYRKFFGKYFSKIQLKVLEKHFKGDKVKNIAEILGKDANDTFHIRARGLKKFKELYFIKGKWVSVKRLIRHKTDKQLFMITQRNGQTVVTKDHSLIKISNGKYKEAKVNEFNVNELVSLDQIDFPQNNNKVGLKKYIKIDKNIFLDQNSNLHCKQNSKYRKKSLENYCLKSVYKDEDLMSFVRILGAYIAEGSTSKREVSKNWDIANTDIKFIKQIKKDMERISNFKMTISKDRKLNYTIVYRLRCNANLATRIFPELCGVDSVNKKIPSFIYTLEKKYIDEFLKYLFLGDGYLSKGNKRNYTTKSLRLISGLSFLWKRLGIDHTIVYRKSKSCWALFERKNTPQKLFKISQIDKVESKSKYVYDLEVDSDSHIFIDACGSILLHNSDDALSPYYLEACAEMINKYPEYKVFNFSSVHFHPNYKVTLRGTFRPGVLEKGHEIFSSGTIVNGTFIFHRECYEKLGGFPVTTNPWDFASKAIEEYPELKQFFWIYNEDNKNGVIHEMGNPIGQDFFYFYKLTREYHSKPLELPLYIAFNKGERKLT